MKKTLAILSAATALAALVSVPAWPALHAAPAGHSAPAVEQPNRIILADADEQSDGAKTAKDGEREDDEGTCDDDEGSCGSATNDPAPAGTAVPPQNGLFGNGAPPKAQVN
ncbi:MAG: hypothetical protein U1E46_13955 [Hyphomicrobiales bacterium]